VTDGYYVLTGGTVAAVELFEEGETAAGMCVLLDLRLEVKGKPEVETNLRVMVHPAYAFRMSEMLTNAVTECATREVPN
jgi:hypothetical protein